MPKQIAIWLTDENYDFLNDLYEMSGKDADVITGALLNLVIEIIKRDRKAKKVLYNTLGISKS